MRIAYASYRDARRVQSWSGTEYHMTRSLIDQGVQVDYLGPVKRPFTPINFARWVINRKLLGMKDHPQRDPRFARLVARQLERRLRGSTVDAVLGHGVLGQAYLNAGRPMAVWTDATFANLIEYFPHFKNMSPRSIRDGHAGEKDLLTRCDRVIFSCQWAIDSAIRDYGCDPKKLRLLSFGANVPDTRGVEDIERMRGSKPSTPVRLLLMGVHWERKGADTAVAVAKELHARGVPVELQIAGCMPEAGVSLPDYVKLLGFISKATPEGASRIEHLLGEAHFFILPSRADCTPIVFCEAASFGLPVLTRDTGGIASVVTNGVNGMCFEEDASPAAYAEFVVRTLETPGEYRRLALSSFNEYKTRLNWKTAGARLLGMMQEMVAAKRPATRSLGADFAGGEERAPVVQTVAGARRTVGS